MTNASQYANEIYLRGMAGATPPFTTVPADLEQAARVALGEQPFWYVAGSAGSGATVRANREALDSWRIVPHMLTGSTHRDLSTTVLGSRLSAPVITAPIGVQSIVHPDAERAVARVAHELGIAMALSTVSSLTLEDVAVENRDGPRWFQLYWPNDPDVCVSFLERAKAAGFTALVVTLDTWLLGWRPHDLDNAFLPFLAGEGLANYFTDPAFLAGLEKSPADDLPAALMHWLPMFSGTDHNWDEIAFLREHWDGPIALKGIQCSTMRTVPSTRGCRGSSCPITAAARSTGRSVPSRRCPRSRMRSVTGSRCSSTPGSALARTSSKALALGARAVLIGRPWVYGLGLGGTDGVRHVLRGLLADLELTMALSGHRTPADLTPDSLQRRP